MAVRLYELDHGRRPDKLADLVPDYLPEIPIAPLLEGAQQYTFGDLNFDLLGAESDARAADSEKTEDDDDDVDDAERQDDQRRDGGSEP